MLKKIKFSKSEQSNINIVLKIILHVGEKMVALNFIKPIVEKTSGI